MEKILIVVADYYIKISDNLIKSAVKVCKKERMGFDCEIVRVPGCFEIPYSINKYINDYDGFIALGCIIRGETYHFELIANECTRKIMDLSCDSNKPIGFGIITCENIEQAENRSNHSPKKN